MIHVQTIYIDKDRCYIIDSYISYNIEVMFMFKLSFDIGAD